jgi:hypothetical protein
MPLCLYHRVELPSRDRLCLLCDKTDSASYYSVSYCDYTLRLQTRQPDEY